ncbi:TPA: hypothetical protein RQK66_004446 [Vibrio vulnificus]|uniref:hypothetical protein n=1 Tax=Vibrio sp. SSH13-20 TaxID=3136668 RepID=UPI0028C80239|nr:hypothetical protein [Vibrio harveyi]HDY7969796.1 hypothetical protein [Vibrio vulnificus]
MKFVEYSFSKMSSTQGYKALFKGAVALATLFLVATMQVSTITLPIEKSAHELWYKVESKSGKTVESIDKLECSIKEKETYSDCKMAKYQNDLSTSSVNALTAFQGLVQWLACILFAMAAVGFLLNPFMHSGGTIPADGQNSQDSSNSEK